MHAPSLCLELPAPGPLRATRASTAVLAAFLGAAAIAAGCRTTTQESGRISPLAGEGQDQQWEADAGSVPIQPDTYVAAGRLAESRGDLAMAANQYRHALERNASQPEALYRLGVLLSRQRDAEAVRIWQRYIAATNGSATGWANLGFSYELLGNPSAAEAAYLEGIEQDPGNTASRVNYGMFLAARGDYEGGAQQMSHVLTPAQSWYNVGSVCERQEKPREAMAAYERALEHDPALQVARRRLEVLREQAATRPSTAPADAAAARVRPALPGG